VESDGRGIVVRRRGGLGTASFQLAVAGTRVMVVGDRLADAVVTATTVVEAVVVKAMAQCDSRQIDSREAKRQHFLTHRFHLAAPKN